MLYFIEPFENPRFFSSRCDFNVYTLQLISRLGPLRIKPKVEKMETGSSDEEEEEEEIRVLEEVV